MRFRSTVRYRFEHFELTFAIVAAVFGHVSTTWADSETEIPANAFVSRNAGIVSNRSAVMPYSAVVAPAPSDRFLDRTRFESESPPDSKPADATDGPQAAAGDDVLAYAGRRATLNGGMSQPVGRIGVRWIQISGPPVREAFAQGPNLVVVPPEPGVYQFLLVVAEGSRISEPDSVILTAVAHPEDEARKRPAAAAPSGPEAAAAVERPQVSNRELFVKLTTSAVSKVAHRPETADELARVFDDVAGKMALYGSYAEAHQELSRRITPAIDGDTADAATWNRQVFEPLTAALSVWVAPAGMDPGNSRLWSLPLTDSARSRLADGLKVISEGFRTAGARTVADKDHSGLRR